MSIGKGYLEDSFSPAGDKYSSIQEEDLGQPL
jgi:hypothetical protein